MDRIAENGGSILFASSEMEELISLADRVCVRTKDVSRARSNATCSTRSGSCTGD